MSWAGTLPPALLGTEWGTWGGRIPAWESKFQPGTANSSLGEQLLPGSLRQAEPCSGQVCLEFGVSGFILQMLVELRALTAPGASHTRPLQSFCYHTAFHLLLLLFKFWGIFFEEYLQEKQSKIKQTFCFGYKTFPQ